MLDFDFKVLARKIVALLLSILFNSLKYMFYLSHPTDSHAISVACAGLHSTLFIWLNIWYISHLVKRPYISGRKSQTLGDPLNDADMLTSRIYIWSSMLLALSSVMEGTMAEGTSKGVIMNFLCGVILVTLIWPQRLLFLGLKDTLYELFGRNGGTDVEIFGASGVTAADNSAVLQRSTNLRKVSVIGEEATKIVEKMTKVRDVHVLFALQRELLARGDLSVAERKRWTAATQDESYTSYTKLISFFYACRCKPPGLEHIGGSRLERLASRLVLLLLGVGGVALTIYSAHSIVSSVVSKIVVVDYDDDIVGPGVDDTPPPMVLLEDRGPKLEYVCVGTAVLSAVLSEVARVRWTRALDDTARETSTSSSSSSSRNDAAPVGVGGNGSTETKQHHGAIELGTLPPPSPVTTSSGDNIGGYVANPMKNGTPKL